MGGSAQLGGDAEAGPRASAVDLCAAILSPAGPASGTHRLLLVALALAQQEGPAGAARLAEMTGLHGGTVRRQLADLEAGGWVSAARSQGLAVAFALTPKVGAGDLLTRDRGSQPLPPPVIVDHTPPPPTRDQRSRPPGGPVIIDHNPPSGPVIMEHGSEGTRDHGARVGREPVIVDHGSDQGTRDQRSQHPPLPVIDDHGSALAYPLRSIYNLIGGSGSENTKEERRILEGYGGVGERGTSTFDTPIIFPDQLQDHPDSIAEPAGPGSQAADPIADHPAQLALGPLPTVSPEVVIVPPPAAPGSPPAPIAPLSAPTAGFLRPVEPPPPPAPAAAKSAKPKARKSLVEDIPEAELVDLEREVCRAIAGDEDLVRITHNPGRLARDLVGLCAASRRAVNLPFEVVNAGTWLRSPKGRQRPKTDGARFLRNWILTAIDRAPLAEAPAPAPKKRLLPPIEELLAPPPGALEAIERLRAEGKIPAVATQEAVQEALARARRPIAERGAEIRHGAEIMQAQIAEGVIPAPTFVAAPLGGYQPALRRPVVPPASTWEQDYQDGGAAWKEADAAARRQG